MKLLITGGAGYLGSILSLKALAAGHEVRVIDNLLHGGQSLPSLIGQERFEFIHGDVCNEGDVEKALRGADALVHLAAIVGDPACSKDPELARALNYTATLRVMGQARAAGVSRFVFASTCSNYGRMADPTVLATENHELKPVSLYAETKVAVEEHILTSESSTMASTVLRFATLYGSAPRMRFDLTVNEFTMRAVAERTLIVYGDQFWRPYVHVYDAARAILKVLDSPEDAVSQRVFNVGNTGENFRKRDLVEMICQRVPSLEVVNVHKTEDPRDYRVSFERIHNELGFTTTKTVRAGILEIAAAVELGVFGNLSDPRYYNTPTAPVKAGVVV